MQQRLVVLAVVLAVLAGAALGWVAVASHHRPPAVERNLDLLDDEALGQYVTQTLRGQGVQVQAAVESAPRGGRAVRATIRAGGPRALNALLPRYMERIWATVTDLAAQGAGLEMLIVVALDASGHELLHYSRDLELDRAWWRQAPGVTLLWRSRLPPCRDEAGPGAAAP
ncbi:MAG: hypothetical protein K6T75_05810 [Acetobacteraceae bacterium]|nr:hypothetical protein [Acetobacteraceae bacterium]